MMIRINGSIILPWLTLFTLTGIHEYSELLAQEYLRSKHPQDFETAKQVKNVEPSVVSIKTFVTEAGQDLCRIGTGFIYDGDGTIITRGSVIVGGDSIIVTLTDGRQSEAWVVHHDEVTEMVLLKISMDDLYTIPMGKSSRLVDKSQITVVGNSLGVFPSVTLGTYLGRRTDGMLRLGIMVPPGNSGSPVLDDQGRLVGILAGRVLDDQSSDESIGKMGVALPVEEIKRIVDEAFVYRDEEKGWIGITALDLEASHFGKGVRVVKIVSDGPADRGGICVGDTIIGFEDRSVRYTHELAKWVKQSTPKQRVVFTIIKRGREEEHTVDVDTQPWMNSRRKAHR